MKYYEIMKYLFSAIVLFCFTLAPISSQAQEEDLSNQLDKLKQVFSLVNDNYVDTVDMEKLTEKAIVKTLQSLDPHSVYIPAKDLERANEGLQGNFEGVGIQFNIIKDSILVVATIEGGPSEKVGLLAGDRIVTVDGENVAGVGIDNKGVAERLRGPKDSEVTVEIARRGEKQLLSFMITRDKIPLYSVPAWYMVDDKVGYIKVTRFAKKTIYEFKKALRELEEEGLETLILDLQGNGGGYLNTAFYLADEFLSEGRLIVYTEGENSKRKDYNASSNGGYEDGNLIILVDQSSASASEIVSGAVQDWDRGLLIGRRTFGKGLVQQPFGLVDGSAIRLTIANYYTPSGRFIQKPYEDGSKSYRRDLLSRLRNGELTDSAKAAYKDDSLVYYTENGRAVYGGGGIMPDVFVALDTTWSDDYAQTVRRKGMLNKFVLQYLDKYRDQLSEIYTDASMFKDDFSVEGDFIESFYGFVKEKLPEMEDEPTERSAYVLGVQLKALLARNLFGDEGFYRVQNDLNDALQRALEIIENEDITKRDLQWQN